MQYLTMMDEAYQNDGGSGHYFKSQVYQYAEDYFMVNTILRYSLIQLMIRINTDIAVIPIGGTNYIKLLSRKSIQPTSAVVMTVLLTTHL